MVSLAMPGLMVRLASLDPLGLQENVIQCQVNQVIRASLEFMGLMVSQVCQVLKGS